MQERLTVRIGANISDFEKSVSRIQGRLNDIGGGLQNVGGNLTKWITLPALGAATAAAGITAAFGWERLASLDTAQAQLRGLGYEADDVERISGGLVEALDGGMMTMADATFAAANAMAAGVQEGDELTKYIQMLDAAVVGGNGTFEEMQQIFSRVADEGSLTRREFDMMADRMPGFSQAVAEYAGASGDALYDMLNNGEITLDDFLTIMENHGGGMAEEYAKTWRGMVENTKNYVGILGETMLGGVFEDSKLAIAEFIELLKSDEAVAWAENIGVAIGNAFSDVISAVKGTVEWFINLSSTGKTLVGVIAGIAVSIGPVLMVLGTVVNTISKLTPLVGVLGSGIKILGSAFAFLISPVGLIIAGIAALGAGFALAYNKSEAFRNFINGIGDMFVSAWESIKAFCSNVIDRFTSLFDFFRGDGITVSELLSSLGMSDEMIERIEGIITNVRESFNDMKEKIGNVLSEVGEVFSNTWNGIKEWWSGNSESIFGPITTAFDTAKEWIGIALSAVGEFFSNVFTGIREWWNTNGEAIIGGVVTTFEWMSETISLVMDLIGSYVEFGWNNLQTVFSVGSSVLSHVWDVLWTGIQNAVNIVWPIIQTIVQVGWSFIQNLFQTFAPIVTGIWNTMWPLIQGTLQNVWDIMKTVVQVGADFIQTVIKVATSIIDGDWSGAWEHIKQFTSDTFENIKGLFSSLRDRAVELIGNLVGQAKDWFLDMWDNLTSRASDIKNDVVNYITGMKDDAIARVTEMFNSVTGWFSDLWSDTTQSAKDIYNDVTNSFGNMKDGAIDRSREMWDGVSGWFSDTWDDATTSASNLYTDVTSSFTSTKDDTIDSAREMWSGVTDFFGDIWDDANELFDNMVDGAKELPGRIGDAIRNMASFAVDGVKSMGNSMAGGLQNVVDGVTGGLNDILDAIGVGDVIPSISIPTFSTGTNTSHGQGRVGAGGNYATFSTGTLNGRIAQDMQGILNDVGPGNGIGGAVQEVIERNGKLLAPQGKNTLVELKKGDRIYNGAETQSMMSAGLIPRFSQGTGSEGGDSGSKGLLGTLKDVVSNVWNYISNPGEAFSALMDSVTPDFSGFDGFAGKLLSGGFKFLTDGIKNFISNIFKENEGALGSGKRGRWMSYRMTTPYSPNSPVPGYPTAFNGGRHYGIDYGTPIGTPITAPTGGQLSSFWNEGGGRIAKLVTGQLRQFFMHMSSVGSGSVQQGDIIGMSGNTGRWTTGPHVHWQAQQGSDALNTNTINPLKVINGYSNGGIVSKRQIAEIAEDGPEAVIPLSSSKRGRANQLYDAVGGRIGRDDSKHYDRMINNQQTQIDQMTQAINVLLGIEDKSGFDPGKANKAINKHVDDRTLLF